MNNREKYKNELIEVIKKDGKLCEFVKKHEVFRMYQDNVYGGRPMPKSDKVIMAAMCKVALALTTISEATKKKADEWLEANNFSKGIWI